MSLIFVDVEAWGDCPTKGQLTEFGAVEFHTRDSFHGKLIESTPDPTNPAVPLRTRRLSASEMRNTFILFDSWICKYEPPYVFVSDNPAYDWQWINCAFHDTLGRNPFGHSARRIGDFYAGLMGNFYQKQYWKRLRVTKHDHNPVHDALGNVEAFQRLLNGER